MAHEIAATYQSPDANDTFRLAEPLPEFHSPESDDNDKTSTSAYFRALGAQIESLQARINAELTERMAQDAARAKEKGILSAAVDDSKEEENYGEEVQEED